ncbi:MAG TPA: hypothetical protein VHQ93_12020 [Chitinophagaceae bacterium]|jgi:hypothetical protein|nr:hypothetical protein [Chitinophagaceae bacterium]
MKRYFFLFTLLIVKIITNAQPLLHWQSVKSFTILNDGNLTTHLSITSFLNFSQTDNIIGSWNLVLQAFDDNSNGKLDEGERKKGNTGKHFYQFNADGTCLIHTLRLKGSYELKNENGKRRLYTYVDDEGTKTRENAWYLISVTKTEMILLSQDKYAFWIYKRV